MTTNVFTKYPKRGDIWLREVATKKDCFITLESFSLSDVPSTYMPLGVVAKRTGKDVLVVYKYNASYTWCDRYSHKLTGYTLDGTNRTGVISIRDNSGASANTDYTVQYNATTMDALVSQLNAFFQATPVFSSQDWVAVVEDGAITVHYAYTFWQQASYNGAKSGFAFTVNLMPDVPSLANIRRKHGGAGGEGVISSWDRALAYFRADNSSTSYNPSTNVTSVKTTYPICLPGYLGTSQYQSDHCAFLRSVYGEGEEGWLKYMASCLPVDPTDAGNMGQHFGKEMTAILASKTYSSPKKTNEVMCKAAYYCHNITNDVIARGELYLPTVSEVRAILDGVHYGTNGSRQSDELNKALYMLGGKAISNGSYLWSSCRYYASNAGYANGYGGFFSNYNLYVSFSCVPVLHLTVA